MCLFGRVRYSKSFLAISSHLIVRHSSGVGCPPINRNCREIGHQQQRIWWTKYIFIDFCLQNSTNRSMGHLIWRHVIIINVWVGDSDETLNYINSSSSTVEIYGMCDGHCTASYPHEMVTKDSWGERTSHPIPSGLPLLSHLSKNKSNFFRPCPCPCPGPMHRHHNHHRLFCCWVATTTPHPSVECRRW